jgi:hypothetical protein
MIRRPWLWGAVLLVAVFAALAIPEAASANHDTSRLQLVSPGDGSFDAFSDGVSKDGTRIWFRTQEPLVPQDTNSRGDLYEFSNGAVQMVSVDLANRSGTINFGGASNDGTKVFFDFAPDASNRDIYMRSGGTTTLISTGPQHYICLSDYPPALSGFSGDGSRVYFVTDDMLVPEDTDCQRDVYERVGGQTKLISTGPTGGNAELAADPTAVSRDGNTALFITKEQLVSADTDSSQDVYERSGDTTALVSTGPTGGNGAFDANSAGISADGSKAFFITREQLVGADTDTTRDIYQRSGGVTTLVSTGPAGGNGAFDAVLNRTSSDGSRVIFSTLERLTSDDTDSNTDIYERSGTTTTLLSKGSVGGNGPLPAQFDGATPDASHVYFRSGEVLEPTDQDGAQDCWHDEFEAPCWDLYERSGGVTKLVSTGPSGGTGAFDAFFDAVSDDGKRVFFRTSESLVPSDIDGCQDDYERFNDATTLISTGPSDDNSCQSGALNALSSDGKVVAFYTAQRLVPADADGTWYDVYAARVLPYDTPAEASPLSVSLVPELRQTISSTQCQSRGGMPSTHGAPLSLPSCNPPGYVPGTAARLRGVGSASLTGAPGNLATTADEADLGIAASLTDVRAAAGRDYLPSASGPDITLLTKIRLSDLRNGSFPNDAGTTSDLDYSVPVNCTATADPATGSNCAVTTSADSLAPGTVVEGKATVIQSFRVRVRDSGTNGVRGDGDDKHFASQGIYVP